MRTPADADGQAVPQRLFAKLLETSRVLLTGPVAPDGDSLGACLALQRLLERHGGHVSVAGNSSYRYDWMPGIERLLGDDAVRAGSWDAVVVLDGDRHRLTPACEAAFASAPLKLIVDHHASTKDDGYDHFWLDPESGSTCEMLYQAMEIWGEALDPEVAACLYTGLIFDTGGFRYSNTRPSSHEMAADLLRQGIDPHRICLHVLMDRHASGLRLAGDVYRRATFTLDGALCMSTVTLAQQEAFGMQPGDLEGIVESLVQVKGVEVGVLVIEQPGGHVKLSLRSRDTVDVAEVARTLDSRGGGHTKASGVRLNASVEEICGRIEGAVATALNHTRRNDSGDAPA